MGRKRGRSAYLPGADLRRRHPPDAAAIFVVAAGHAHAATPLPTRGRHLGCGSRACAHHGRHLGSPDTQDGGGAWTTTAERRAHARPPQQRWQRQQEDGGGGDRHRGGKRIAPASSPSGPPSRGPLPPCWARLRARARGATCGSPGGEPDPADPVSPRAYPTLGAPSSDAHSR